MMARSNLFFALAVLATVSAGVLGRELLQSQKTVRWVVPANGASYAETVPVGGAITFTWTSTHDLWEVPSSACPATFANGSGITQVAARSSGGSAVVNFPTAGTRYFACSVSTHCEEGQHITVTVGSASPAPAPGPSRYGQAYGGGSTCGGNSTSGSGYGGSSGSGSNYTGNSTYGGSTPSTTTPSSATTSSYGGGTASYAGGGANYGGGSSDNYGAGRKMV